LNIKKKTFNFKSPTITLFPVTYIILAINSVPFRLYSMNVLNKTQFRPTVVMPKDETVLNLKMNRRPNMCTTNEIARVTPFKDSNDVIELCEQVKQMVCLCLFGLCAAYISRCSPTHATSEPRRLTETRWRPKQFSSWRCFVLCRYVLDRCSIHVN